MLSSKLDPLVENLAWEVMIVSVFRNTEIQSLNLIATLVGVPEGTSSYHDFVKHIFRLIRKGIIYIPEARLQIFHDAPELVDVYFLHSDFDTCMKGLVKELNNLKAEMTLLAERRKIPEKFFIDLKNWSQGKYV